MSTGDQFRAVILPTIAGNGPLSACGKTARSYKLPHETLPTHSIAVVLERLRRFEEWCAALGVRTQGTRVARYRRYLDWLPKSRGELDQGIFLDSPGSPIKHPIDRFLYTIRELHELTWISESLRDRPIPGLERKLTKVVRGADLAALDRNTESRDTQFELRIASYLARAGYRIAFDDPTDIAATRGRSTYYVECKRIASEKQLVRRINEATAQLRDRIPRTHPCDDHYGLVAIDVTTVAFKHNGLTFGVTPDHTRDILQDKLRAVDQTLASQRNYALREPAIALWMQIHIASLVRQPFTPITRVSSYFIPNPALGFQSHVAAQRIYIEIIGVNTREPGDEQTRPLKPRRVLAVPAGTRLSLVENLLESIVANNGKLPELPDEEIVVSVKGPNADQDEWQHFNFYELKSLFARLSEDERHTLATSVEVAFTQVVGGLLALRYPYIGHPSWLDGTPPEI